MKLNDIVPYFLKVQAQFRICHWQTKSFARHNAFGGIYDALDDLIDKFIEVHQGKYGRFVLDESTIEIQNLSDLDLTGFLKELKLNLINIGDELDEIDTDLINIKDEMLAEVNKLTYLLTLE